MKITVELTQEEAQDILSTAVEGGIDYWADTIKIIERTEDLDYLKVEVTPDSGTPDQGPKIVSWEDIQGGVNAFLEKYQESGMREYILSGDVGNFDAEIADAIVQMIMFGELVYG